MKGVAFQRLHFAPIRPIQLNSFMSPASDILSCCASVLCSRRFYTYSLCVLASARHTIVINNSKFDARNGELASVYSFQVIRVLLDGIRKQRTYDFWLHGGGGGLWVERCCFRSSCALKDPFCFDPFHNEMVLRTPKCARNWSSRNGCDAISCTIVMFTEHSLPLTTPIFTPFTTRWLKLRKHFGSSEHGDHKKQS